MNMGSMSRSPCHYCCCCSCYRILHAPQQLLLLLLLHSKFIYVRLSSDITFTTLSPPFQTSPDTLVLVVLRDPYERLVSNFQSYAHDHRMDRPYPTVEDVCLRPQDSNVDEVKKIVGSYYHEYFFCMQDSELVRESVYSRSMPNWLEHFTLGKDLLVLDGDAFVRTPWEELEKVRRFLGMEHNKLITKVRGTGSKSLCCCCCCFL